MNRPKKSTAYGILYLALIPSFAVVYNALPDAFYHATVGYETSLEKDYRTLEREFGSWLVQNQRLDRAHRAPGDWAVYGVSDLSVDDRKIAGREEKQSLTTIKFTEIIETPFGYPGGTLSETIIGPKMTAVYQKSRMDQGAFVTISQESDFDVSGGISLLCDRSRCELKMPGHLADLVENYYRAQTGFPSQASGNFERMLYLSAMTATTVGYGDIVPITRASRLLVALEAVLEVVVVGLFLNSLANKRGATSAAGREHERAHSPQQRRPRRWTPGRPARRRDHH